MRRMLTIFAVFGMCSQVQAAPIFLTDDESQYANVELIYPTSITARPGEVAFVPFRIANTGNTSFTFQNWGPLVGGFGFSWTAPGALLNAYNSLASPECLSFSAAATHSTRGRQRRCWGEFSSHSAHRCSLGGKTAGPSLSTSSPARTSRSVCPGEPRQLQLQTGRSSDTSAGTWDIHADDSRARRNWTDTASKSRSLSWSRAP
jgi:hypothetical protein